MALERGFKAWSERMALSLRSGLEIAPEAPLAANRLAQHLDINLRTLRDFAEMPIDVVSQLTISDPSGWSAVSFDLSGVTTIIHNDRNSAGRQSSDIMHELAHVIRGHEPSQLILSDSFDFAMRSYDSKQEDEANWLGWAILLPRPALARCADLGMSNKEIALEYTVSEQLVAFRRRITGIDRQNVRSRPKTR
ncbi:MAG TPA: ImmA/IrrE family metallo-endopeptidase [Paraburkholderia sp.]|uniref:ImmA/IrrE family metallo-endopeptidase n=1 Tax=Paraburkholderia sp. TaxID=1926495 RepID=UPI002B46994D|nr:ImmA/IrrE family metallo-endopeptidase [Paraburkholderia sp.]HKR41276.1 ImmA/IrrE family metallo-endopeptidase [Paraburkholderia sp.]